MMNFMEFAEYAKRNIKDFLPEEYQQSEVRLNINRKINETYMGLTVDRGDGQPTPAVSVSQMFDRYEGGESLESIMQGMSKIVQMEMPHMIDVNQVTDYEQAKFNLFVRLSDKETNQELMSDGPYEEIDGLLATYHVALGDEDGMMSVRVTKDLQEQYGISDAQLKSDAMTYMPEKHPAKIASLGAMIGMVDSLEEGDPVIMFVGNETGTLGAGVILYPGIKEQIAEQFGHDFFILPSSTHEVLVVADDGNFSRGALEDMVRSANQSVVEPADRLSDHVYHYDAKDRIMERAETFEARMAEKEHSRSSVLGKLKERQDQISHQAPMAAASSKNREALVM